ncbi:hypothetical protein JCM17960_19790 [Magnetospira thiophila]
MGDGGQVLDLDVGAYGRALTQFDLEDGAASHHNGCRKCYQRPFRAADPALVAEQFLTLPLLTPQTCAHLRHLMDHDPAHLRDQDFLQRLLEDVFQPPLDGILSAYFGSEYAAQWYSFQKFDKADGRAYSFAWHFDAWSSHCLKLLCYLNATEDHGGPTQILDVRESLGFARAGYAYPPKEQRLTDLTELAEILHLPCHPRTLHMAEGEALLFNPVRLLHRGVVPTLGPRYLLQICLAPSPLPWRENGAQGYWPYWDPGSNGV